VTGAQAPAPRRGFPLGSHPSEPSLHMELKLRRTRGKKDQVRPGCLFRSFRGDFGVRQVFEAPPTTSKSTSSLNFETGNRKLEKAGPSANIFVIETTTHLWLIPAPVSKCINVKSRAHPCLDSGWNITNHQFRHNVNNNLSPNLSHTLLKERRCCKKQQDGLAHLKNVRKESPEKPSESVLSRKVS